MSREAAASHRSRRRIGVAVLLVLTLLFVAERRVAQYASFGGEEPGIGSLYWLRASSLPDVEPVRQPRALASQDVAAGRVELPAAPVVPRSPPR